MKHRKPSMTGLLALTLCLAPTGAALAWGGCEHRKQVDETLDLADSRTLEIIAAAGDLEVTGVEGRSARVRATVCVSEEEWLEEAGVDLEGGDAARIAVRMPDTSSFGSWGNKYAYIDLAIEVPRDVELSVRDSSGDMELKDVGVVAVKDSSGDIDIDGALSVEVEDSSGDIEIMDVVRDVTIVSDSSGDIRGGDIDGNVVVLRDSSGDIRFREVGGDVLVERDSSGDIEARDVGGDFAVLRDGSGEVRHSGVAGKVDIPDEGP